MEALEISVKRLLEISLPQKKELLQQPKVVEEFLVQAPNEANAVIERYFLLQPKTKN